MSRGAGGGRPPTRSGKLSIGIDPDDKAAVVARAACLRQPVGEYLVDLAMADIARATLKRSNLGRRRLEVGVQDARTGNGRGRR